MSWGTSASGHVESKADEAKVLAAFLDAAEIAAAASPQATFSFSGRFFIVGFGDAKRVVAEARGQLEAWYAEAARLGAAAGAVSPEIDAAISEGTSGYRPRATRTETEDPGTAATPELEESGA